MSSPTAQPNRKVATALFISIVAVALGLRLWGITWGLPDSMHYFSFHPDENLMVTKSMPGFPGGLNVLAGNFLPHYYNYGSLPFYEISIALTVAGAYHFLPPLSVNGVLNPITLAHAILVARLLSVFFGVGTVWAVYAFARRLYGEMTALISAAFLAIIPLHVQHSHYATVDVGAAFWQTMSMVYAAKVYGPSKWTLKYTVLAGVMAGFCAATKYSGVLVILCLLVALYLHLKDKSIERPLAIRYAGIGCIACIAAFVIACPGCILETKTFLDGVRFESDHVMHHGEISFLNTGPGWIFIVTRNLDAGMGLPMLVLSLGGIILAMIKRRPGDIITAVYAIPTYLLLGAAQSRYARYEIALLPILAIRAGELVAEFCVSAEGKSAGAKLRAYTFAVLGSVVLLFTVYDTYNLLLPMTQIDPRERAALWIESHVPDHATIATGSDPWFYTPTLNPYFAWYPISGWRTWPPQNTFEYCFNPSKWFDQNSIGVCNAPVTTVSEYQYIDPLRLNQPDAVAYFHELELRFGPPIVFESHHPLGGRSQIDGLPTQDLPTDMLYPSPTVLVYARH